VYKVFGTWRGGYLYGDSWRLNSGITKVEKDGPILHFHGDSGSIYSVLNKEEAYGTSGYTGGVLGSMVHKSKEENNVTVEILPFNTDWTAINYG
jgi:hypothetical protein